MNLSKVFDYLDELRNLVDDFGYYFDLNNIMVDDEYQTLTIRLVSGCNGDILMRASYHNIFDSDNPRKLAAQELNGIIHYFRDQKPSYRVEVLYRG